MERLRTRGVEGGSLAAPLPGADGGLVGGLSSHLLFGYGRAYEYICGDEHVYENTVTRTLTMRIMLLWTYLRSSLWFLPALPVASSRAECAQEASSRMRILIAYDGSAAALGKSLDRHEIGEPKASALLSAGTHY